MSPIAVLWRQNVFDRVADQVAPVQKRSLITCKCLLIKTPVRLGKSGLKVSRVILGCMSYGTPEWSPWALGEEVGIAQIKFACVYYLQLEIQGPEESASI